MEKEVRVERLGFLAVHACPQHGHFGGLLIVNPAGRPLEFHCTAPIMPNRAQEILYGTTLIPYLYGELIGCTLIEKAMAPPQVLCIEELPVSVVSEFVDVPVLLVRHTASGQPDPEGFGRCQIGAENARQVGRNSIVVCGSGRTRGSELERLLEVLPGSLDLVEPFERIRRAIEEAKQSLVLQAA
jgi:hypothetical protein